MHELLEGERKLASWPSLAIVGVDFVLRCRYMEANIASFTVKITHIRCMQGAGYRVQGAGCRVQGAGCMVVTRARASGGRALAS